ncbi:MAG: DUF559 domain-containing protein [Microcella sp.]|uniref:DUF559 domain-containing protein n=1 Tax=Microcella sp. TaxID=1913979 RepID=UPI003314F18D
MPSPHNALAVLDAVQTHGGVAATVELARAGLSRDRLASAVRRREVVRLRRGVLATPSLPVDIARAARVGGRLAHTSALDRHGLWVPPGAESQLCVALPPRVRAFDPDRADAPLPAAAAVTVLRERFVDGRFGVAPLVSVVRTTAALEREEFAIAVLDSVLRRTALTQADLHGVLADAPAAVRARVVRTDPRSGSGAESVLRIALASAGIPVVSQPRVALTDLQRWDFLVGDRLVIEVDGDEHHSTPRQRRADRRRDLDAHALGFLPLRVDAAEVLYDVGAVVDAVVAVVARGHHLDSHRSAGAPLRW